MCASLVNLVTPGEPSTYVKVGIVSMTTKVKLRSTDGINQTKSSLVLKKTGIYYYLIVGWIPTTTIYNSPRTFN